MAWIESHTVLSRHRKVVELAGSLGIKPVYAMAHLHALWHSALEQQEDGNLSKWTPAFIAAAAQFEGDPKLFTDALNTIGWMDNNVLHDWIDYAGMYLTRKYASSKIELLRRIWKLHNRRYGAVNGKKTVSEQKVSLPNLTIPNLPNLTKPTSTPAGAVSEFDRFWNQYPKRLGRKQAEKHFKASVKTPEDLANFKRAFSNYMRSINGKEMQFIQHGSTWFNNWADWVHYTEEKNHAPNGSTGVHRESDLARHVREVQGLRKTGDGDAEALLSGIRNVSSLKAQGEKPE